MPIEKGRRMKDWHCSICGRVYAKRNATRRKILNKWWLHMGKYHPEVYLSKKKSSVKKMLATKRKRGIIGRKTKKRLSRRKKPKNLLMSS